MSDEYMKGEHITTAEEFSEWRKSEKPFYCDDNFTSMKDHSDFYHLYVFHPEQLYGAILKNGED